MKTIKVLSLFSGIGAFERALENLKIPHEIVAYCEIDKYAAKAYSILHNISEDKNLVDVRTVDTSKLGEVNLVTYGFPCQDISLAGYQRGLEHEGEQTRSGLVWDAHRIIKETMPEIALCENVKNLTSKKFAKEFEAILSNLEDIGYNNYWQILNAKDFGVPQNRERVFIVSIRKDIDKGSFKFPEGKPLEIRLKDILLPITDEKYFISDDKVIPFLDRTKFNGGGYPLNEYDDGTCRTIKSQYHQTSQANFLRKGSMGATGVLQVLEDE